MNVFVAYCGVQRCALCQAAAAAAPVPPHCHPLRKVSFLYKIFLVGRLAFQGAGTVSVGQVKIGLTGVTEPHKLFEK